MLCAFWLGARAAKLWRLLRCGFNESPFYESRFYFMTRKARGPNPNFFHLVVSKHERHQHVVIVLGGGAGHCRLTPLGRTSAHGYKLAGSCTGAPALSQVAEEVAGASCNSF